MTWACGSAIGNRNGPAKVPGSRREGEVEVELAPGATSLPQVEVTPYGFVAVIEEMDSEVVPSFVNERNAVRGGSMN